MSAPEGGQGAGKPDEPRSGVRRWGPWVLRGMLGAGVLAYLVAQVGGGPIARTLGRLDLRLWLLAVLLYLGGQAMCAYKWGLLARALGMRRPYRALVAYYFGGMFANLFLPTTVGGDVGRAAAVARPNGGLARGLVSVLADRASGLVGLLLLASAGALSVPGVPANVRAAVFAGTLALLAGGLLVLARPGLLRRAAKLQQAALACRRPVVLAPVLLLSLAFQALVVLLHALMGRALGLSVPLPYYLLAGTLVALVAMVPVSVNGIGTRDAAYVAVLGLAGVPGEAAVAFALSWLALIVVCSAVGGLLFVLLAPAAGKGSMGQ